MITINDNIGESIFFLSPLWIAMEEEEAQWKAFCDA
jgi:hypothetical protein